MGGRTHMPQMPIGFRFEHSVVRCKSPKRNCSADLKWTSAIIYNPIILGTNFVAASAPAHPFGSEKCWPTWCSTAACMARPFRHSVVQLCIVAVAVLIVGSAAAESRRLAAVCTHCTVFALVVLTLVKSFVCRSIQPRESKESTTLQSSQCRNIYTQTVLYLSTADCFIVVAFL